MVFNFYLIRVHVIIGNRSRLGFSISLMRNLPYWGNPFLCDQCPGSFSDSSNLKKHKRTHSGEESFPCDKCFE